MEITKPELFNRKAALPESKSDKVVDLLAIVETDTILDIGSGGGYFSFLFAQKAKKGTVFAFDTNKEYLSFIEKKIYEQNIRNVKTLHYDGERTPLEESSCDLLFLRNVTHHIKNRKAYFQKLKKLLKNNGKIAIIDYKKGKFFSFYGIGRHYVKRNVIIKEMKNAGYIIENKYDFLTKQIFIIFRKN